MGFELQWHNPVQIKSECPPRKNSNIRILFPFCKWNLLFQEEECKEAVLNALAEYFGPEAKEPLDFMQKVRLLNRLMQKVMLQI